MLSVLEAFQITVHPNRRVVRLVCVQLLAEVFGEILMGLASLDVSYGTGEAGYARLTLGLGLTLESPKAVTSPQLVRLSTTWQKQNPISLNRIDKKEALNRISRHHDISF